ncbi:MAG: putative transcriptional regulator [Candidatus Nitrosomirales archaeon]|jgi:predicted transcriptional regulator
MKLTSLSADLEGRAPYDVYADLLRVLVEEPDITQTKLAMKTNLDTRGIARYLEILLRTQLVLRQARGNRHIFQITERGREFMQQYKELTSMIE